MRISAKVYMLIYNINKMTKKWLEKVNNEIREKGIDNVIVSYNKNYNIHTREDNAIAKYAPEDKAKIDAYKKRFTPINEGEKTLKVIVDNIDEDTIEKSNDIFATLENDNDKVITKAASIMTSLRK